MVLPPCCEKIEIKALLGFGPSLWLELEARANLQETRIVLRRRPAKTSAGHVRVNAAEIRPVEQVKDLQPKLQIGIFVDMRVLEQREVGVRVTRVPEPVCQLVALRTQRTRRRDGQHIEDAARQLRTARLQFGVPRSCDFVA